MGSGTGRTWVGEDAFQLFLQKKQGLEEDSKRRYTLAPPSPRKRTGPGWSPGNSVSLAHTPSFPLAFHGILLSLGLNVHFQSDLNWRD